MEKVIHPCDVPMWDGKKYPLFCKIEFSNGRLSISGVIGPNKNGNAKGGCGQVDMEFDHADKSMNDSRYSDPIKADDLRFVQGWDANTWHKFLAIWNIYHLNDLTPNCQHMRDMGKIEYISGYTCPVCGYKSGSAWMSRTIPQDVIEFLQSLPDTDRTPNWV